MLTLHLPKRIELISQSFKGTDPGAWIMLAVAIASLTLILAAFFTR